jgi:hypothetical protein
VRHVEKKYLAIIVAAIAVSILIPVATLAYAQGSNGAAPSTPQPPYKLCNVTKVWAPFAWHQRFKHGFGWGAKGVNVVISDEYKQKVLSILQSDSNTAALLSQGYNITCIKPVVSIVIGGDGTITLKATKAIVTLSNGSGGRAVVYVDVEGGKVLAVYKCEVVVKPSTTSTTSVPSTSV